MTRAMLVRARHVLGVLPGVTLERVRIALHEVPPGFAALCELRNPAPNVAIMRGCSVRRVGRRGQWWKGVFVRNSGPLPCADLGVISKYSGDHS